MQTDAGIVVTS